MKFNKNTIFY